MALSPSQMTGLPAVSNEAIWVGVRAEHPITGNQVLTSFPVAMAIIPSGAPVAGDWKTATWEATQWVNPDDGLSYYLAKLDVGSAGAITLTRGWWQVWVKFTTGSDTPVVGPARLKVV